MRKDTNIARVWTQSSIERITDRFPQNLLPVPLMSKYSNDIYCSIIMVYEIEHNGRSEYLFQDKLLSVIDDLPVKRIS